MGVSVIATTHEVFMYMGLRDREDIVFSEPNPEDVANKILIVLKDEELRKRLSEKGPLLAKSYYYDIIASRILREIMRGETK
jgi:glycosyltransferase involved in cell wall biosynthesis